MDTPVSDSQALPPGIRIEEFVIERVLGSGGFGITYLARDVSLNRHVVIKENLPTQFAWRESASGTVRPRHANGSDADDYEWSMKSFLREAETLASLDHSGIVRVLRKFEANGTAYFIMPYVEGIPFDRLIDQRLGNEKPFSEEELRGLLERVLMALDHIHGRGIYHRDIKPANILISTEGIPVLIDFGSARQRLSDRSLTVIESAGYTPFEQLQSHGNQGPWSDLYALGGTLEKAITGVPPPKAMDRMRRDPRQALEARSDLSSKYSPSLLGSIDKALQVEENQRWQNAEEWLSALRVRVGSTPQIQPPPAAVLRPQLAKKPMSAATAHPSQRVEISKLKSNRIAWIAALCLLSGLSLSAQWLYERQRTTQATKVEAEPRPAGGDPGARQRHADNPVPRMDDAQSNQMAVAPDNQQEQSKSVPAGPPPESSPKPPVPTESSSATPLVMPFPQNRFFRMIESNNVFYVGRRGGKCVGTFEALQPMHDRGSLVLVMNMLNDPYAGSPGNVIIRNHENGSVIARFRGVRRSRTYRIPLTLKPSDRIVISIENDHGDGMKLRAFQGKVPDLYLEPAD